MTEGKILAANWKMAVDRKISQSIIAAIKPLLPRINSSKSQLLIAPSAPYLAEIKEAFANTKVKIAAQNACWAESGAFTGEISAAMLKDVGADFAIIGHSERRSIFSETDNLCAERTKGLLAQNISVIYCIGETKEERESSLTEKVLEKQLCALKNIVNSENSNSFIIAYEPVWAIGTGLTANADQIFEAHKFIAEKSKELFALNESPAILYGGSVNANNWSEIMKIDFVGGALVGGASQKAETLLALCEQTF